SRQPLAGRSRRPATRAAGRPAGQIDRRAAVMAAPGPIDWRITLKRRVAVVAITTAVWVTGIEARLMYLQIFGRAELVARAERQQLRTQAVPPKRGDILDRRGRVLATSVDADSVYAVPTEIANPAEAAAQLCGAL